MSKRLRFFPFIAFIFLLLTGCAGPLEVKYEPKTAGQFKTGGPVPVFVSKFVDKRDLSKSSFKDPRSIGKIEATVSDMTGDELTLSEDVTDVVANAYKKELAIAGFTLTDDIEKARYALDGQVREFRVDIGTRDDVAIEIASEFKDAQTGRQLWTGVGSERGDRFAGVMGNSRHTISNHIAASLQKTIRSSIAAAGAHLDGGKPAAIENPSLAAPPEASGTFTVGSAPGRSKVYIDGVYYGLTPLTLKIAPGVYEVTLKQKGFKTLTEKVSIRQDAATELEAELEKE
jgi:hypothetical protein